MSIDTSNTISKLKSFSLCGWIFKRIDQIDLETEEQREAVKQHDNENCRLFIRTYPSDMVDMMDM